MREKIFSYFFIITFSLVLSIMAAVSIMPDIQSAGFSTSNFEQFENENYELD